jgi:ADP-ribosyl-[dinitrogen reductase] hydrolase
MNSSTSRLELCLLGGLLGDAWGGAYEGQSASREPTFPRIAVVSDDTQLVMATCEALLESGGRVEPDVIASRFCEWSRSFSACFYALANGLSFGTDHDSLR